MSTVNICGHMFWKTQAAMLKHARKAQILIKFTPKLFTYFDSFHVFLKWFKTMRKICKQKKRPLEVYEILSSGMTMCFACDIEVYCPISISKSDFERVQYTLKQRFIQVYNKYGDGNNVVFMENHRSCSYKPEGSDTAQKMRKLSFHALGLSEIFNEMHTTCEMQKLAEIVNMDLVESMGVVMSKHQIVAPHNNILDMKIYTRNRALRSIYGQKDIDSGCFKLSEGSKHVMLQNCFVTQRFCEEVITLYSLPEELQCGETAATKPVKPKSIQRNTPKSHKNDKRTVATTAIELRIKKYLELTFGDKVTVKYQGLYNNQASYRVDGHRHCPICKDEHFKNGAFVNDIGGGNFSYKCLANLGNRSRKLVHIDMNTVVETSLRIEDSTGYLESFTHVTKKVISICGPMGCGKTYQIKKFLELFPPGTRVLFLTCRKGMARSLSGRFQGFTVYLDKTNQALQIQEYESLNRITTEYSIIVIDEVRSMLASAACFETNGINLTVNMERLQDLCEDADHVICADADLYIDGCVSDFYKRMFREEDIHHIQHTSGGQKLHFRLATYGAFVHRILSDMRDGKNIMVCCGSSRELKSLRLKVREIIDDSKIGIYYADCEKQHEVEDVHKYWPEYNFIGFTSTITVSVDYTGPIDTVYVAPCVTACCDRDMKQMIGRARNNVSGTVILLVGDKDGDNIIPLDVDMDALKNQEENIVRNRRSTMQRFMSAYDREFYGSIRKEKAGSRARYFTTLLTDLWLWARVEEHLKMTNWVRYFLTIIEKQGHTWTSNVETLEDSKLSSAIKEDMKQNKISISSDAKALLDSVDVTRMGVEGYKVLMKKKIRGNATPEDMAKIQKYLVQMHYEKPVDADFVNEFTRQKKAIYNRTFITRFPPEVVRKIHLNTMNMKDSLDLVNPDVQLIPDFEKTLRLLGFESVDGSSAAKIDMAKISEDAKKAMEKVVKLATILKLDRKARGEEVFSQFNFYLEKVLGYTLKYHRVRRKGLSPSAYSLVSTIPPKYLENTLYSNNWLESHCQSFDLHMNRPVGTEFALLSQADPSSESAPLIPDELGMWTRVAVLIVEHYVLIRWDSRLKTSLEECNFHVAVGLLDVHLPWRGNINHEKKLVAGNCAVWIKVLIHGFDFREAKRCLHWWHSLLIVYDKACLTELKALYISRVRACRVLQKLKHLWALQKEREMDHSREPAVLSPSSATVTDCAKCAQESREENAQMLRHKAESRRQTEERNRQYDEKMRPFHESRQKDIEQREQADTTVVILDDNTLRRNGVLMKKFFYKPGDSIDRSYGWVRASEAS